MTPHFHNPFVLKTFFVGYKSLLIAKTDFIVTFVIDYVAKETKMPNLLFGSMNMGF